MHMKTNPEEWLILGVTPNGRPFRPSDWAERLCGALARYDHKGRWVYSSHAHPVIHQGQVGIRVKTVLKDIDPNTYAFILGFAYDNQLKVVPGREVLHLHKPVAATEVTLSVKKLTLALLMHQWKMRFPFGHR